MESSRLVMALAIYSMILLGFAAAATTEDAGEIAPSPAMENRAISLGAPAVAAAVISLVAWFF
ncbi:hypothetical protein AAC387_Pa05g0195 [Persea americana]